MILYCVSLGGVWNNLTNLHVACCTLTRISAASRRWWSSAAPSRSALFRLQRRSDKVAGTEIATAHTIFWPVGTRTSAAGTPDAVVGSRHPHRQEPADRFDGSCGWPRDQSASLRLEGKMRKMIAHGEARSSSSNIRRRAGGGVLPMRVLSIGIASNGDKGYR